MRRSTDRSDYPSHLGERNGGDNIREGYRRLTERRDRKIGLLMFLLGLVVLDFYTESPVFGLVVDVVFLSVFIAVLYVGLTGE